MILAKLNLDGDVMMEHQQEKILVKKNEEMELISSLTLVKTLMCLSGMDEIGTEIWKKAGSVLEEMSLILILEQKHLEMAEE